jgi:hypothetical protein
MKLKPREIKQGSKEFRVVKDLAEEIIGFCQENTESPGVAMNAMLVAMALVLVEELERDEIATHVETISRGLQDNVDRLLAAGYCSTLN